MAYSSSEEVPQSKHGGKPKPKKPKPSGPKGC